MLNHNPLKIVALLSFSFFCSTASSGELCTCPTIPKGTECSGRCADNPGGGFWDEDKEPPPGTLPPPAADSPDKKNSRKLDSESKTYMKKTMDKQ